LTLAFFDECGFSPSQPVGASWALPGRRKRIPYENPRRRRVNALAALVPDGPAAGLTRDRAPRSLTAEDVLGFLEGIPRGGLPLVVVLDNAPIHISHVIRDARPGLAERGITLYYLPGYSPRLNAIEPFFGVVKYHELPERTYPSVADLGAAIDAAFERVEARLLAQSEHQLRPAA
jgi:putative transposase